MSELFVTGILDLLCQLDLLIFINLYFIICLYLFYYDYLLFIFTHTIRFEVIFL